MFGLSKRYNHLQDRRARHHGGWRTHGLRPHRDLHTRYDEPHHRGDGVCSGDRGRGDLDRLSAGLKPHQVANVRQLTDRDERSHARLRAVAVHRGQRHDACVEPHLRAHGQPQSYLDRRYGDAGQQSVVRLFPCKPAEYPSRFKGKGADNASCQANARENAAGEC